MVAQNCYFVQIIHFSFVMKFIMIMQLDEIWDLSTVQNHTIIQHQKPFFYSISWTLPAELQQHLVGRPAPQQTTKPTKTEKYRYNIFSFTVQKIFAFCPSQLQRNYNGPWYGMDIFWNRPILKWWKLTQ